MLVKGLKTARPARRILIPLLSLLCVMIAALCLCADFRRYEDGTKTRPDGAGGIVFSITTYDGKSESRPFVACMGHTWLSVENQTGHPVTLNDREIAVGEVMTFSIWAISDHRGVVYNLEANFIRDDGRYDGRQSLSVRVDESALSVMEDYIAAHDDWTLGYNCSRWSVGLWNAVVGDACALPAQTLVWTPARLTRALAEYDSVELNKDFRTAGGIWFDQNGVRTELELCE